ncbi:MAG: tyrosine-type recombinase/integrase [Planctomycetota bacterium]|nr:tyrosine-type recombinase/integrase [Planctomycetota bacterium]
MPAVYRTNDRNGKPHPRWRFRIKMADGSKKAMTGFKSKEQTEKLAWKLESEQDEIRKGLRSPPKASDIDRPFGVVVQEYLAWGAAQGGHGGRPWSKSHLRLRKARVQFWQERLALENLSDVYGILPEVEAVIRELQGQGNANKTIWNKVEALAAFCDWSLDREYLSNDPLKKLRKIDTTPKIVRRALTPDEIALLLAVSPPHRRLTYLVALTTGLRANELRNLTRKYLDLVNGGIIIDPAWAKGRKAGFQPLPARVVAELALVLESLPEDARVLHVPGNPAAMLYRDLDRAGIPRKTSDGKIDFHALRTSFVTLADENGASAKQAQQLGRHSTPKVTFDHYVKARKDALGALVEKIGNSVLGPAESSAGVKQDPEFKPTESVSPSAAKGSGVEGASPMAGSNPAPATVEHRTNSGQISSEHGPNKGVMTPSPVASGTDSDQDQDGLGRAGSSAEVKQDGSEKNFSREGKAERPDRHSADGL